MILILIRHGTAENQHECETDWKRRLTERGKAEFMQASAGIALLFPAMTRIISSPKARAVETAETLALFMHEQTVEKSGILLTDDLQGFIDEYGDPAIWAAAVGHEPYMGLWCAKISGRKVRPFPPGAAALLETDGISAGRLLCAIKPKTAAGLAGGKWPFPSEHLAQALHLRKILLSGSGIDEDVHQLRANIRKLDLTLSCVKAHFTQASLIHTRESLKILLAATAGLREYAVLKEMIGASGMETPALTEIIKEKQNSEMAGFILVLSEGSYIAFAEALGLLQMLRKHKKPEKQASSRCLVLMRRIAHCLREIDPEDQDALHKLRTQLRKLRDTALVFPMVHRTFGKKVFSEADKLQASLGRGHDVYTSRMLLKEIASNNVGEVRQDAEQAIIALTDACPPQDIRKPLKKFAKVLNAANKRKDQ